jgi:hypothetical protein
MNGIEVILSAVGEKLQKVELELDSLKTFRIPSLQALVARLEKEKKELEEKVANLEKVNNHLSALVTVEDCLEIGIDEIPDEDPVFDDLQYEMSELEEAEEAE